jgi:hypothetical protein
MSVIYPPETEYAKERVKWESQGSEMGPGKRPYVFRPYPAMIYLAGRPANGLGAHCIVEQVTVESEQEWKNNYYSRGFRATPNEAIDLLTQTQDEFSRLAAELNHEQKHKLSERASAEVETARAAHVGDVSGHMPVVPTTPIKPRKREGDN